MFRKKKRKGSVSFDVFRSYSVLEVQTSVQKGTKWQSNYTCFKETICLVHLWCYAYFEQLAL